MCSWTESYWGELWCLGAVISQKKLSSLLLISTWFLFPYFIDKRALHSNSSFPINNEGPLAKTSPGPLVSFLERKHSSFCICTLSLCVYLLRKKSLAPFCFFVFFFVYTRCLPMFQLTLYYVLFLGGSSSKSGSLDLECTEDFPSYQQNTKWFTPT